MNTEMCLYPDYSNSKISLRMAAMLFGVTLLINSPVVFARAYRCADTSGNITYSQSPCAANQTGSRMRGISTSKNSDRKACTHVRRFATESFEKLQDGTEPSMLINEYGGPGYISPITLNTINFASSFRFNKNVSARKVGAMAYNKCANRGFGKIQTSDLPDEILPPRKPEQDSPAAAPLPARAIPDTGTY